MSRQVSPTSERGRAGCLCPCGRGHGAELPPSAATGRAPALLRGSSQQERSRQVQVCAPTGHRKCSGCESKGIFLKERRGKLPFRLTVTNVHTHLLMELLNPRDSQKPPKSEGEEKHWSSQHPTTHWKSPHGPRETRRPRLESRAERQPRSRGTRLERPTAGTMVTDRSLGRWDSSQLACSILTTTKILKTYSNQISQ